MTDAFDKMKASMQEKKQEAEATVEEWKRKREVNKLEGRAQSAQEYAEAAIHVVGLALDEATAATLDAAEARRVADEAKKAAAS
jgi:sugar-specific transcriptional regulator TrmB